MHSSLLIAFTWCGINLLSPQPAALTALPYIFKQSICFGIKIICETFQDSFEVIFISSVWHLLHPVGSFGLRRPPQSMETLVPLLWGKPMPAHQVYLNLHQLCSWHKSTLTQVGE